MHELQVLEKLLTEHHRAMTRLLESMAQRIEQANNMLVMDTTIGLFGQDKRKIVRRTRHSITHFADVADGEITSRSIGPIFIVEQGNIHHNLEDAKTEAMEPFTTQGQEE